MTDNVEGLPDDEICRVLFRKRDKIQVGRRDPFEDYATEFYVEGRRWLLRTEYYPRYSHVLYTRRDHWSETTYFRPNAYLLNTLRKMLDEISSRQIEQRKARYRAEILA